MSFKPVIAGWKRFMSSRRESPWGGLAASVTGESHLARQLPNQDFARIAIAPQGAVAAVADGHSMPICCRADCGSRIAVEVTIETCLAWLASVGPNVAPNIDVAVELSEGVRSKWLRRVRADVGQTPFTPAELAILASSIATPAVAYGATLVAAVATDSFCLGLQVGDGQLFGVNCAGIAGQLIIPAELDGEASDSLCQPEALAKFRFALVTFDKFQPAAIVCTTDGYDKAFRSVGDFLQIGSLFVQSLRAAGPEQVAAVLPAELREASDKGSGDDVSCAILYRKELYHGRTR